VYTAGLTLGRALRIGLCASSQGHAEAMSELGKLMLRAGAGPPERAEGRQWLETAHARGSATAARRLAKLSVAEDPAAALALWRVSAERGSAKAQFALGCALGDARPPFTAAEDRAQATAYLSAAADRGHQQARLKLYECHRAGWGADGVSEADAMAHLQRAAEAGVRMAQYELGRCCATGQGTRLDGLLAEQWWLQAVSDGSALVQYELGTFYADAKDDGARSDWSKAMFWWRAAAEQEHRAAQFRLGVALFDGAGALPPLARRPHPDVAARWWMEAAKPSTKVDGSQYVAGHPEAQFCLARWYMHVRSEQRPTCDMEDETLARLSREAHVVQCKHKAVRWFRSAAQQQHAQACFELAVCYTRGEGVTQSIESGTQWFQTAASLGDKRALALLGARKMLGVLEERSSSNAGALLLSAATEGGSDETHGIDSYTQLSRALLTHEGMLSVPFREAAGWVADVEQKAYNRFYQRPLVLIEELQISVTTAPNRNAGTTGSVSVKLHGALRTSDLLPLKKSQSDRPNFQEGQVDSFKLSYEELGDLHSVTVSKSGGRADDDWKLDSVYVEVLGGWPERTKKSYTFECDAWFTPEVPLRTLNLSSVRPRVRIIVRTGNVRNAGTNAKVWARLIGSRGQSALLALDRSDNHEDPFETNQIDEFVVKVEGEVGRLQHLEIGHDGSGFGAGWFLDHVMVAHEDEELGFVTAGFPCHLWLDTKGGDQRVQRRLCVGSSATYLVQLTTATTIGSSTNGRVFITFIGAMGESSEHEAWKSGGDRLFQSGQTDAFEIRSQWMGPLLRVRIRVSWPSSWKLEACKVSVDQDSLDLLTVQFARAVGLESFAPAASSMPARSSSEQAPELNQGALRRKSIGLSLRASETQPVANVGLGCYSFYCGSWLNSDCPSRELLVAKGEVVTYCVIVRTSQAIGAGTDSSVGVNLYGTNGQSGPRSLDESKLHVNKFERGQVDMFELYCPELGDLSKLVVWIDGKGVGSDWKLHSISVRQFEPLGSTEWTFVCNSWLREGRRRRDLTVSSTRQLHASEHGRAGVRLEKHQLRRLWLENMR
jgi:TPR repeat protein